MKKIVLSFFALFMVVAVHAQDTGLKIGLQASPMFTWMGTDDKDVNRNGTNVGMQIGLLVEHYFQENYAITSGLGFSLNTGGTLLFNEPGRYWPNSDLPENVDSVGAGTNLRYNIQYIEIPLGLKLRTREYGYMRYFAEPFLKLGFESSASGKLNAPNVEETDRLKIRREVNTLATSIGIGVGAEYSVSPGNALIGGLYYQRLFSDISNDVRDDGSKATINALIIRLGFLF